MTLVTPVTAISGSPAGAAASLNPLALAAEIFLVTRNFQTKRGQGPMAPFGFGQRPHARVRAVMPPGHDRDNALNGRGLPQLPAHRPVHYCRTRPPGPAPRPPWTGSRRSSAAVGARCADRIQPIGPVLRDRAVVDFPQRVAVDHPACPGDAANRGGVRTDTRNSGEQPIGVIKSKKGSRTNAARSVTP